MTDTFDNSKKARKELLPPDWVEHFSTKYPERNFYFNKKTGESRWSPPLQLQLQEKVMESERKSKKRKVPGKDTQESSCASLSNSDNTLNASISDRPKLKVRKSRVIHDKEEGVSRDTPIMQLYREKLAQRKLALEAKKNTPKKATQKQKKHSTPPEITEKIPTSPSVSQKSSRNRQRLSNLCNETISSDCSSVSSISVDCTKANEASSPAKIKRVTRSLSHVPINTTDKISKTKSYKKKSMSSKSSPSCNTSIDINISSHNLTAISKKKANRRRSIQKYLSSESSQSFECPNNAGVNNNFIETISPTKSTEKNISKARSKSPSLLDECSNIESNSNEFEKNLAFKRLTNFKRSLNSERDIGNSSKSIHNQSPNYEILSNSSLNKSKLLNQPSPILYKNAHARLYSLENRVRNTGLLEINKNKQDRHNEEESEINNRILGKIEAADERCEQMEWEPIEDEKIMSEVHSVRFQLCERPSKKLYEFPCSTLKSLDNIGEKYALYIIVDTNVFLSNLSLIEEIRDSNSDIFGRPFIVIPWIVLQELDFIKDNKNHTRSHGLKLKARNAVDFLNKHFSAKHPRFLGQTPMDVEKNKKKFVIECPDDEILQTCLQIKELSKSPILLSYDKNLCNKAMIHDIPILGRNDPLEKMYYLKAAETTEFLSSSLDKHVDANQEEVSILQKELLAAEDIMENGKAVLKHVLSKVVAKEMENLFGKNWEMHVIIRPPWSIITVLKCALKHWMAAVSESFIRRTESMLRDILVCIKTVPEGGRKLQDVKFFLDKCNDIVQTLNNVKYSILKPESLTQIDELKQTCINTIEKLNNERFKDSVGYEDDASEEERRASLAFKVFEEIYSFARDTCGLSADAMGLQCSFSYNKMHPFLTTKTALQYQQNVGISVNKLLQTLRLTLSKLNEGIGLNDKNILNLYEDLLNFSSELHFEELTQVTPLDIYCCIKLKKATLEKGYEQLQELAIHFCRMANYQCL